METWTDWEKQDAVALKLKEERDNTCITCPKCGSQWFEEIKLTRYQAEHNVILGQTVPPKPGSIQYVMLKCGLCSNVLEPRVVLAARDIGGGDYNNLLDTLDGKFDTRKKEEVKKDDAIPSKGL